MYFSSNNGLRQQSNMTSFINDGEINLYGINSIGVTLGKSETLNSGSSFYFNRSLNIYSDGSRGIYIPGDISNLTADRAVVRVKIGKNLTLQEQ